MLISPFFISQEGQIFLQQIKEIDTTQREQYRVDMLKSEQPRYYSKVVTGGRYDDFEWELSKVEGEGNIAVITLPSVIRSTSSWYMKGMDVFMSEMRTAGVSEKISSVILKVGICYGGEALGATNYADFIGGFEKNYGKKLDVVVEQGCFSAGYFIISQAKKIHLGGEMVMMGSIGTKQVMYDDSEYMKNMGIKKIVKYATDSVNKDMTTKEMSDETSIKTTAQLDMLQSIFSNNVIKGRGSKLNTSITVKNAKGEDIPEVLSGAEYVGNDIIEMGLADDFMSLDGLISKHEAKVEKTVTNNLKYVVNNLN